MSVVLIIQVRRPKRLPGYPQWCLSHQDGLMGMGLLRRSLLEEEKDSPPKNLKPPKYKVHGDFNPTNILIRQGMVSGIVDWEFCHSGTPYMDIGNLLRNTDSDYHSQIKLGIEAGGMSLPSDWKERAELVDLGSHLEFLTSNRSESFKRQCVVRIDRFIRKFILS